MDIIKKRLEAIRERADWATAGPWTIKESGIDGHVRAPDPDEPESDWGISIVGGESSEGYVSADDPNIRFIAHARTDVPQLVAMLEVALEGLRLIEGATAAEEALCYGWAYEALKSIAAIAAGEGKE